MVTALGGITVREKGFVATLGDLTSIAFLALLVWIVASAVMLWRPVSEPA